MEEEGEADGSFIFLRDDAFDHCAFVEQLALEVGARGGMDGEGNHAEDYYCCGERFGVLSFGGKVAGRFALNPDAKITGLHFSPFRRAHRRFVVGAGEFLFSVAVIFECARRQHGRDQRREQQGITSGSEPSLLAGHSAGEYAALVATGRVILHASALDPNNKKMAMRSVTHIVACGRGKVLAGMVKRIAPDATGLSLVDNASFDTALAQLRW